MTISAVATGGILYMTESHPGVEASALGQRLEGVRGEVCAADELPEGQMQCPVCGHSMPDLKGGKATICPVCGFKDSCCY